jgi:Neuraminidase (sialidase)
MVAHQFFARLSAAALLLFASSSLATPVVKRATLTLSGGENVMGTPGTYTRANYLQDGSILGAYAAVADDINTIIVVTSTDGGVTWTETGTVATGSTSTTDINNPYPLQLPNGRVLIAFRNHSIDDKVDTYYRITICYSDDNGATWAYLSQPASDPGPTDGNWEPLLRMAEDGVTLQLYYSRQDSAVDQESLMRTSTDGGSTWSAATVISSGGTGDTRDGMVGVATVDGENLIMVFESETDGGLFSVYSQTSSDDGTTWGNRALVYEAPSGWNAQAPQVINVGGTLVVSFMYDPNNDEDASIQLVTSTDGGSTWSTITEAFPTAASWAGMMTLSDDTSFLVMASIGNTALAQVVVVS